MQINDSPEYLASQGFSSTFATRFLAKIKKDKTTDCWLWQGYICDWGYGTIRMRTGKLIKSHRAAWILYRGPIHGSLLVLHNCPGEDRPACCNPSHLWLGTDADNMRDASRKGRMKGCPSPGESNPNGHKLTDEAICQIREIRHQTNIPFRELAAIYQVSAGLICNVCNRKRWRHLE